MKTLTAAQMREADRRCIEEIGIPGVVLMHNAGEAVFDEVDRGPVGIVCGKGNNGGDGFVVARLALLAGYQPRVVLLADPEAVKGDAAIFLNAYHRLGGQAEIVLDEDATVAAIGNLRDCPIMVDAILGTGSNGEVTGLLRAAIEAWSLLDTAKTISVDLPSGLDSDTGEPLGSCIRADVTVTMQFIKRGFENPRAREYIGHLVVADIGIPEVCADDEAWGHQLAHLES